MWTKNIHHDSVDFASSSPCDHRHEEFWKPGGARAVEQQIMLCPCNPKWGNPFCIHFSYRSAGHFTVTDYLQFMGYPDVFIREFQVSQTVASLLDTTRRLPGKWNVSPSNRTNLAESRGILLRHESEIAQSELPSEDRNMSQILIDETRNRLALYAPADWKYFLNNFWNPVHENNIRRQLSLREQSLQVSLAR
jgi:hypothetical protein